MYSSRAAPDGGKRQIIVGFGSPISLTLLMGWHRIENGISIELEACELHDSTNVVSRIVDHSQYNGRRVEISNRLGIPFRKWFSPLELLSIHMGGGLGGLVEDEFIFWHLSMQACSSWTEGQSDIPKCPVPSNLIC